MEYITIIKAPEVPKQWKSKQREKKLAEKRAKKQAKAQEKGIVDKVQKKTKAIH